MGHGGRRSRVGGTRAPSVVCGADRILQVASHKSQVGVGRGCAQGEEGAGGGLRCGPLSVWCVRKFVRPEIASKDNPLAYGAHVQEVRSEHDPVTCDL